MILEWLFQLCGYFFGGGNILRFYLHLKLVCFEFTNMVLCNEIKASVLASCLFNRSRELPLEHGIKVELFWSACFTCGGTICSDLFELCL